MAEKKYRSIDEITHNGKPLREILEAHRRWLQSGGYGEVHGVLVEGNPYSRADLRGADLSKSALMGAELSGADLRGADLSLSFLAGADLSGANLIDANLSWANLCGADMSGILLTRADLSGANLRRADLSKADLSGTNLSFAVLFEVDLNKANLSEARLHEAYLSGAFLEGTDFTEAEFWWTVLADCDLSNAIGLEKVVHAGPSSIGADTIINSQGKIPEVFLRGVGVPEQFIRNVLDLRNNPIEYYRCFISYADEDAPFADRLYSDLQNRGVRCWLYHKSARAGRGVQEQIGRAIGYDYDKVIVICSQNSLNSSGVIDEIERAIQREDAEKRRDILVSIRIDDYVFGKWDNRDWEIAYKARLKSKHIEDFTGCQDANKYGSALDRLLQELNRKQADEL